MLYLVDLVIIVVVCHTRAFIVAYLAVQWLSYSTVSTYLYGLQEFEANATTFCSLTLSFWLFTKSL